MKKINEFINNNLLGVLVVSILLGIYTIALLVISSDKYEKDIYDLRKDLAKSKIELQTSYNTIEDLKLEHQECEYFIVPTEDGFVIDGRLYEEVEGFEVYE